MANRDENVAQLRKVEEEEDGDEREEEQEEEKEKGEGRGEEEVLNRIRCRRNLLPG